MPRLGGWASMAWYGNALSHIFGSSWLTSPVTMRRIFLCRLWLGGFNDLNFRVGQAVQFINESVNLAIRGVDLALEHGLILRCLGGGNFFSFLNSA